jgi:tetratricopeptide (TPR) repeat protein
MRVRPLLSLAIITTASVLLPVAAAAQAKASGESLGEVHFEVSCGTEVQPRFDRAVAYLHHMTYARAQAEFRAITETHPSCAMAYWGVAMTLFQPLWPTRPSEADLKRGWEAMSRAKELAPATERERLLIAATAAFFDPATTDYWQRIERWARGMSAAYEAFPDDVETTTFFALSHLAASPASGDASRNTMVAAVLEAVLRAHPAHPGAVHYTIHANDAAGRESESLDVVRRYGDIAPRNPHALHMPTHIYVRLGDWPGVIEGNRLAAQAALENPVGDRGQWVWDEYPHAIEYLVYALLQVGDDPAALQAMTVLQQTANLQPSFKTAFNLSSIPARYALERRDWVQAANLEARPGPTLPWDRFPWPEAVTWFARGFGAVRSGNVDAARDAEARLGQLRVASEGMNEDLFARQTEILRLSLAAWLARADGDAEAAIRLAEQAVRLEDTTPKHAVTPAPTLPAAELMGDLLLEMDRPDAALRAYQTAMLSTPRRFHSLAGAARSARRMNDDALAARFYRELRSLAVPHATRPELVEADAFLKAPGR